MKRILIIFTLITGMIVLMTGALEAKVETTSSPNASLSSATTTTINTKASPSDSYLMRNRQSVSASTNISTIAAPEKSLFRSIDRYSGWEDPFLPGGDGWETGETGNVGYPISDISFPILLSMLLIYFVYRGASSTKRRNNF